MKIIISFIVMLGLLMNLSGQNIDLTFTAVDNESYVQLDSIKVMNRTQGGNTVLYWPDTVLSLYIVGIDEPQVKENAFQVFQNYPNPVIALTTISMYVPEKDNVSVIITDVMGRVLVRSERMLEEGIHSFRYAPGTTGILFLTVEWKGVISSIQILSIASQTTGIHSLEYDGFEPSTISQKTIATAQNFIFSFGDTLLYIGYADTYASGILDAPEESQIHTFQFAANIPCPGTPTITYEGQVYNTIQVFSQCWLKENLNVGWIIPGEGNMTDNGFVEKYCYSDNGDSCLKYGGLYQWDEMMQYNTNQGVQGICPPGWHLPTDEEWKVLEGAVDSQYGIGDPEWDIYEDWRGFDAGTNLKTISGWYLGGNGTDLFDFSGLPGGIRGYGGPFIYVGQDSYWWTSTEHIWHRWSREIRFSDPRIIRYPWNKDAGFDGEGGFSVRCIRDEIYLRPVELNYTAVDSGTYVQLDSVKIMNLSQGGETKLYWPDTTIILPEELYFETGDLLLSIGYTDSIQSGILDTPDFSETYTFQFASNIPCPGTPTVEYEGQVYNTIQVFSQCWLKENLNVGTMIWGSQEMTDNGVIEKYCYNNAADSCTKYGGLYQWDEVMQYTTGQWLQGICPPGWHVPADDEWKVLEGAVDSQYGIGNPEWDNIYASRGFDAGTNLKTTSGWYLGNEDCSGTDLFGFSSLPSGKRSFSGNFYKIGEYCAWFTYIGENAYTHTLICNSSGVGRGGSNQFKKRGYGVRCVKDD